MNSRKFVVTSGVFQVPYCPARIPVGRPDGRHAYRTRAGHSERRIRPVLRSSRVWGSPRVRVRGLLGLGYQPIQPPEESSGLTSLRFTSCSTALGNLVWKSSTFAHSGVIEMRAIRS